MQQCFGKSIPNCFTQAFSPPPHPADLVTSAEILYKYREGCPKSLYCRKLFSEKAKNGADLYITRSKWEKPTRIQGLPLTCQQFEIETDLACMWLINSSTYVDHFYLLRHALHSLSSSFPEPRIAKTSMIVTHTVLVLWWCLVQGSRGWESFLETFSP